MKEGVILSADSIIYIDDKKLEKPKTKEQAKIMLQSLSGRINYAVTGVTIIDLYQNKKITLNEVTKVYFDELSDEEIDGTLKMNNTFLNDVDIQYQENQLSNIPKINGDLITIFWVCQLVEFIKNLIN